MSTLIHNSIKINMFLQASVDNYTRFLFHVEQNQLTWVSFIVDDFPLLLLNKSK